LAAQKKVRHNYDTRRSGGDDKPSARRSAGDLEKILSNLKRISWFGYTIAIATSAPPLSISRETRG
jgi:hypothetical protein